jgi:ferredoxin
MARSPDDRYQSVDRPCVICGARSPDARSETGYCSHACHEKATLRMRRAWRRHLGRP